MGAFFTWFGLLIWGMVAVARYDPGACIDCLGNLAFILILFFW